MVYFLIHHESKQVSSCYLGCLGLSKLLTLGKLKLVNGLTINASGKLEFDKNKKEDIIFMDHHFRLKYKSMKKSWIFTSNLKHVSLPGRDDSFLGGAVESNLGLPDINKH